MEDTIIAVWAAVVAAPYVLFIAAGARMLRRK